MFLRVVAKLGLLVPVELLLQEQAVLVALEALEIVTQMRLVAAALGGIPVLVVLAVTLMVAWLQMLL
jgi:hypothetical protein